jgi:hypothetical protein
LLENTHTSIKLSLRIGILGNKIIEVLISVMTPASKAEGKSTPILGVGVVLILGVVVVKVLRF